ncbi:sensor histidine kinase [Mycobacterium kyorinense]|uniref:histidine kinase n=1 Tax=Mycobacterium kyorinense TaxID=487514 RepID=A0A1X1XJJ4_9MYCO|nr:sensor histidine kinase [Mycobacterium kyorinense]ORV99014.1 histidine kinase [Mycobacterium kyorinense]
MNDGAARATEWHWLWDAYIAGVCITAIAAVFLLNDRFTGKPPVAAALLAGIAVWALTFGRGVPRSGETTWRTTTFVAVAVTLLVLAMWFSIVAVAAIPAIYPIVFSALPLWTAIAATTAINFIPLAIALIVEGPHTPDIAVGVAITLIGVVAAPVIGTMIVTATRQRARLATVVAELAATRAEAERLSRAAGISAERERLAREIHDTLAQGFTSIVALAQVVETELETDPGAASRHVELIHTTARENLAEARGMVADLTPADLEQGSLAAAIQRQCDKLSAETGTAVSMSADRDLPALEMAKDVVLLRAAQEGLTNIRKHAQATVVRVQLTASAGNIRLCLSDNGIGLTGDHADGFGLRGMKARVTQVGGTMTVSPAPGGGTVIQIDVPS